MGRLLEWIREYWGGVFILIVILALIICVGYFGIQITVARYDDLSHLVSEGKILQGQIIKYEPYRGGIVSKHGIRVDEGINVSIEYSTEKGNRKILSEKWLPEEGTAEQEMIGQPVGVYYYPQNKYIEAASFNNPDIQFYLKEHPPTKR